MIAQWTIILGVFSLLLMEESAGQFKPGKQVAQSEDCGIIDVLPNELRTRAPWVAGIFIRPNPKHKFRFLITGSVIGPTTVLTIFSGVYGEPRTQDGKYFLLPPSNYKIVVGMKTNSLEDGVDSYSQEAEVNYILPFSGHEGDNREYHLFIFHLKTPLDLKTPYVRAICVPIFVKYFPVTILAKTQIIHQGGFSIPKTISPGSKKPSNPLSVIKLTVGTKAYCSDIFKKFYNGSSENVYCGNVTEPSDQLSCSLHGSAAVLPLFNNRWFTIGITALIPPLKGKSDAWCDANTVYFYGRLVIAYDWLEYNVKCGAHNFACGDGECIPLDQLCDQSNDCSGGEDEDPIYCRARNPCIYDGKTYECGIYGECIRPELACDGVRHCFDGSDENPSKCGTAAAAAKSITVDFDFEEPKSNNRTFLPPKCPPIEVSEGVAVRCRHPESFNRVPCNRAALDTVATFRCQNYYKSVYRLPVTESKCTEDGTWNPRRPFGCEADCGILPSEEKEQAAFIVQGLATTKAEAFPWHAAIFYRKDGDYIFICGGSLIEKSVVLTAAHCITDARGQPRQKQNFKIALGAITSIFKENLNNPNVQVFNVLNLWTPLTYDRRNLQSDIGIIQLDKNAVFGDYVRPICYYSEIGNEVPNPGEIGKVSGLGFVNDTNLATKLRYASFPVIPTRDCAKALKRIQPLSTFCAGYQNGTAVCQGDSGGGIVFPEQKGASVTRYILKGIVSHGEVVEGKLCNPFNYAVMTHVGAYADWILQRVDGILAKKK